MINFQYLRASSPKSAIDRVRTDPSAQFIAGGTNLIDLMKRGVMAPPKLVDINNLPLRDITDAGKAIRIGALALNSTVADHTLVLKKHPLLAQALNAGASAQIRNMATVGGNMMQRTRCPYFYDPSLPCNKRTPGSGCGAVAGINRMHAIFGLEPVPDQHVCIAVHPSDMCVALAALDATVELSGPDGDRTIPFTGFHRLPGSNPQQDNTLRHGELITALRLPDNGFAAHSHYLKIRDRASYAFALISVAAALDLKGKTIQQARLAMGGVAHKPWRLTEAEQVLIGKPATEATFREAAQVAMRGARAFEHNTYKLKLAPAAIVEALTRAAG